MFYVVSALVFIVAVLLILVILVQNPKGGLASNFSSSNQVMGVRKTTDFLEKATWTLGIALLVFSVLSSSTLNTEQVVTTQQESELIDEANNTPINPALAPTPIPGAPTTTPDNPPATSGEPDDTDNK